MLSTKRTFTAAAATEEEKAPELQFEIGPCLERDSEAMTTACVAQGYAGCVSVIDRTARFMADEARVDDEKVTTVDLYERLSNVSGSVDFMFFKRALEKQEPSGPFATFEEYTERTVDEDAEWAAEELYEPDEEGFFDRFGHPIPGAVAIQGKNRFAVSLNGPGAPVTLLFSIRHGITEGVAVGVVRALSPCGRYMAVTADGSIVVYSTTEDDDDADANRDERSERLYWRDRRDDKPAPIPNKPVEYCGLKRLFSVDTGRDYSKHARVSFSFDGELITITSGGYLFVGRVADLIGRAASLCDRSTDDRKSVKLTAPLNCDEKEGDVVGFEFAVAPNRAARYQSCGIAWHPSELKLAVIGGEREHGRYGCTGVVVSVIDFAGASADKLPGVNTFTAAPGPIEEKYTKRGNKPGCDMTDIPVVAWAIGRESPDMVAFFVRRFARTDDGSLPVVGTSELRAWVPGADTDSVISTDVPASNRITGAVARAAGGIHVTGTAPSDSYEFDGNIVVITWEKFLRAIMEQGEVKKARTD